MRWLRLDSHSVGAPFPWRLRSEMRVAGEFYGRAWAGEEPTLPPRPQKRVRMGHPNGCEMKVAGVVVPDQFSGHRVTV
jgi:hypothetical protein